MKEWVKRWALTALFLAFVLAGCSVPAGPPVQDPGLAKRVFVDVKAAPLDEVLQKIARSMDCTVIIDRRDLLLQRRVTMTLINVTAETALRAVCETGGCRWQMGRHHTLEVDATDAPPVARLFDRVSLALHTPLSGSWKFDRRPLSEILREFSKYTPFDIQVEGADVSMPVTVDLTDEVPLRAIDDVLRAAGLERRPEGNAPQYIAEKNDRVTIRILVAPKAKR